MPMLVLLVNASGKGGAGVTMLQRAQRAAVAVYLFPNSYLIICVYCMSIADAQSMATRSFVLHQANN
jgi:hypothetical protein